MTFKQTMKEVAEKEMKEFFGEHAQCFWLDDVIKTTINSTLKAVEECLGEETLGGGEYEDYDNGYSSGHNTLHRKVKAKLLELSK